MMLRQKGRDFFYLLKISFLTFFSNYTSLRTLVCIAFVLTKEVLNLWGLVGYLKFELSYANFARRHLSQLDVVFVVVLD